MSLRTGQGFDVHKLSTGRKLILGGVEIPYTKGLDGHSDADVLLHAIIDALLGALALGDIGQWFPDSSSEYKGADSIELLRSVLLAEEFDSWQLVNLDSVIIAQAPKLADYIPEMRINLAEAFGCNIDRVSVKATTTEHLGYCGRGEGIAASATLLLQNCTGGNG